MRVSVCVRARVCIRVSVRECGRGRGRVEGRRGVAHVCACVCLFLYERGVCRLVCVCVLECMVVAKASALPCHCQ